MRWFAMVLLSTALPIAGDLAAQSCLQAPLRTGERAAALGASAAASTWQIEAAWLQRSLAFGLALNAAYGQVESIFYDDQNQRPVRRSGHELQAEVELSLPLGWLSIECIAVAASIAGSRTPAPDVVRRTTTAVIEFSAAWSYLVEGSNWHLLPYLGPDLRLGSTTMSREGARFSHDEFFAAPGVEFGAQLRSGRVMITPSFNWSISTLSPESVFPLNRHAGPGGILLALRVGLVLEK